MEQLIFISLVVQQLIDLDDLILASGNGKSYFLNGVTVYKTPRFLVVSANVFLIIKQAFLAANGIAFLLMSCHQKRYISSWR